MKEYKVGASIIQLPDGAFLMHESQAGNENSEIRKLGIYGGQFDEKKDKNQADTACRELAEKSGLQFRSHDFMYEGLAFAKSETDTEAVLAEVEVYSIYLPYGFNTDLFRDGRVMTSTDLARAKILGQLTTIASESISKFREI